MKAVIWNPVSDTEITELNGDSGAGNVKFITKEESDTVFYVDGAFPCTSLQFVLPSPFLGAYYKFIIINSGTASMDKSIFFFSTTNSLPTNGIVDLKDEIFYLITESGTVNSNLGTKHGYIQLGGSSSNNLHEADYLEFYSEGFSWYMHGKITDSTGFLGQELQ